MNASDKRILSARPWPFLIKKNTALTTTASTAGYELPQTVGKVSAITITVGTQIYTPDEVKSEEEWSRLNRSTVTSDSVEAYFIRAGRVEFYPRPSSSSNQITIYHQTITRDLGIADYTSGTAAVNNAATAVTGSGTTWTTAMAGRFIKFTSTNSIAADDIWYEIASVTNSTSLTLVKPYAGGSNITGASYTIGQVSPLPEGYHELPVWDAAAIYFTSIQPDLEKAKMYRSMSNELEKQLFREFTNKTNNVVIDSGDERMPINPNLTRTL